MENVTKYKEISKFDTEVYYNSTLLGTISYNVFSKRWILRPCFKVLSFEAKLLNEEFYESIEAGRALVKLWKDTCDLDSYFSEGKDLIDDFFDIATD